MPNSVRVEQLPVDFSAVTDRVLLDVREDDEWASGHVRGALHIPLGDVPARLGEIDPDAELFVICHGGGRSERVVQYLEQAGYDGANVEGGMIAWLGASREIVTDDDPGDA